MRGKAGKEERYWRKPKSVRKRNDAAETKANAKLREFAENAEPGKCYTLHEIAVAMGVTRERVRQIQQRAMMKLYKRFKQVFEAEGLTPEEVMDSLGDTKGFVEYEMGENQNG